MQHLSSLAAPRRLPRRSRRQQLAFVGVALTISAVFWTAIFQARRDPDPLLYERLVPVTIVLPKTAASGDRVGKPRLPERHASGAVR